MAEYVIGVDVGGTNTDAVIFHGRKVLSSCKKPTSADGTQGVVDAIQGALDALDGSLRATILKSAARVSIGTTHFVNAVVERASDKLAPVAAIRLCGPASRSLPPFADFPSDLKQLLCGRVYMVDGGLECSGKVIAPLNREELKRIANELLSMTPPLKNVAITGVFSPLNAVEGGQERLAAEILREVSPDFSCTLSNGLGMLGLLERENAAILNESLKPLAKKTITAFKTALKKLGFTCSFSLTQNDGTLISADDALLFPVLTFSSGPTNSMRGAMFLSGLKDAIVVDIGGTTTDVGVLKNGFPREASSQVTVGGVRTNFQMPDVLSVGLGGGSIVVVDKDGCVKVGPESVRYELTTKALCFGGDTCTTTDVAIAAGVAKGVCTPPPDFMTKLSASTVYQGMLHIHNSLESVIDQMKIEGKDIPVLLVGGGSVLVDKKLSLKGVSQLIIPPHFSVANAVGAALGTVAGTSEVVESLSAITASLGEKGDGKSEEEQQQLAREVAIQRGKDRAVAEAVRKGAIPDTVFIHELTASPVTYIPDALRVHVKAIGALSRDTAMLDEAQPTPQDSADKEQPTLVKTETPRANPVWPYHSEEDKKKDEEAKLPRPHVNNVTGEWIISSHDVECISIGAGILGCGGGGDPNVGRAAAQQLLSEGKKICLKDPHKVDSSSFGVAVTVAFMGAPVILSEKLVAGTETTLCLTTMQQILATGVCEAGDGKKEVEGVSLTTRTQSSGDKIWLPDCKKLPKVELNDSSIPLHRRITALLCAEAGGVNSFEPLLVGARLGLPVLDADGMGRAFPELQMFLPFIYGRNPYPACTADERGDVVAVTNISSAKNLEEFFRIECVRMGMSSGISLGTLSLDDVMQTCVVYSLSMAWQLGRAIARARATHSSVVEAVVKQQNGLLLLTGKVLDVNRTTDAGFTGSRVVIEGLDKFTGHQLRITAKNENLLAHELLRNGSVGKLLACTPDLITIIDTDTGYPITTEDMRYGLRVSVIAMPAHPTHTTPQALAVVGPSGFGFTNTTYHPPIELTL